MSEALRLYGTEAPDLPTERINIGALSFSLQDGGLRHIRLGDKELIRAIAFLVRDRDWGTLSPTLSEVSRTVSGDNIEVVFKALYQAGAAQLDVDLCINANSAGLSFRAVGQVTGGSFETNRAGFTVLHPASVAGCPASVTHSDKSIEATHFPVLIDPWQPMMDIVSLTHLRDGLAVTCEFEGDCFEMEDQRQWGDASFKTYVRPLALPWPYVLTADEPLTQAVNLSWRSDHSSATPVGTTADTAIQHNEALSSANVVFPDTALVLTAKDAERLARSPEDIAVVSPQRLLCHIDTSLGNVAAQISAFAALSKVVTAPLYDVELVCAFADAPDVELPRVRQLMDAQGFRPASVLVCPAVDRQSTPPGSEWPDCPPLEVIHQVSRAVFGDLTRGGGMVSLFTELNRKRPPVEMLDFVSHGLCPIVHAADDLSVMETLETIPHITRSVRAIIGEGEYRIGPATIAMRQNPYGNRTISNPDLRRICMTDDDPRHRAQFGAAYVVGLACALAPAGVSVWTPSAVYGPRGLAGPMVGVLTALAACAGKPVYEATIADGLATLKLGETVFQANLTDQEIAGLAAYAWSKT